MKIIKNVKLKIDEDEVLRYQDYSKNKVVKPKEIILQVTKEEIKRACNLFQPQGIYASFKIKKISFSEGRVNLEDNFSFNFNNLVPGILEGADYLVFGVVSIGNALEDKTSEFFTHKEYSRGLALDAVGTVAIRYLSRHVRSIICQEAKEKHLKTSKHFTPGTTGWDISQQKNIFEIIPADKIGVKLTNSYMMIPKKSLSWAIGVGKNIIKSSKDDDSCQICQAINCQFRRDFNLAGTPHL